MDYRVDLVGGIFDGATDIYLLHREVPPDRIYAFTCISARWCGGRKRSCVGGRAHTWISEGDEDRPPESVVYGLRSFEGPLPGEEDGVAVYGRGDFWPVGSTSAEDEIDEGEGARRRDLVTALAWPFERASWEPQFAGLPPAG